MPSSGISPSALLLFLGGFVVLLVLLPAYGRVVLKAFFSLYLLGFAALAADRLYEVLTSGNDYSGQRFSLIGMGIFATIAFLLGAYNTARRP